MRDLSVREVEVVEAVQDTIKTTKQGLYRTPTNGFNVKRDTSHGPVVSIDVEEYLKGK